MSDPTTLAHAYVDAFNSRDWEAQRRHCAPSCTYTFGDGETQHGPEAIIANGQLFAGAMSDARVDVERAHIAGETVILEMVGTGTHDGDFMGIAATQRKVRLPVISVVETKNGAIAAVREWVDTGAMLRQLGALK